MKKAAVAILILAAAALIGTAWVMEALQVPSKACAGFCQGWGYDVVAACKLPHSIYCKRNMTIFNESTLWVFHAVFFNVNGTWHQIDYRFENMIRPEGNGFRGG